MEPTTQTQGNSAASEGTNGAVNQPAGAGNAATEPEAIDPASITAENAREFVAKATQRSQAVAERERALAAKEAELAQKYGDAQQRDEAYRNALVSAFKTPEGVANLARQIASQGYDVAPTLAALEAQLNAPRPPEPQQEAFDPLDPNSVRSYMDRAIAAMRDEVLAKSSAESRAAQERAAQIEAMYLTDRLNTELARIGPEHGLTPSLIDHARALLLSPTPLPPGVERNPKAVCSWLSGVTREAAETFARNNAPPQQPHYMSFIGTPPVAPPEFKPMSEEEVTAKFQQAFAQSLFGQQG